jgi:hypothetical protein
VTAVFDAILRPFGDSRITGLLAVSLAFGLATVLIFRFTSDQTRIGALRRRMGARALGMLLHLHSPWTVVKTAGGLLADNFVYLWLILRPMLVIAAPFLVTAAQLDARFGRTIREGPVTVTVQWRELPSRDEFAPDGRELEVQGPVVFLDTLRQTSFRVLLLSPGAELAFSDTRITLGAEDSRPGSIIHRGAERKRFPDGLMKPFLDDLSQDGPVERISMELPEARYRVLGGRWSWLGVFLAAGSLSAVVGAAVFKVKV